MNDPEVEALRRLMAVRDAVDAILWGEVNDPVHVLAGTMLALNRARIDLELAER